VQGVRLPASRTSGTVLPNLVPSNHPIFESPPLGVPSLFEVSLVIHRVGTDISGQADLECPIATCLNMDPDDGLTPPEWQSNVGTCIVARKDGKPLSVEQLEVVWAYMDMTLEKLAEGNWAMVRRFYTRQFFEMFEGRYK
ncbi:hypothetical protein K491DRAFT_562900, partial [Lophiostoma macrostomum CBS 122681]